MTGFYRIFSKSVNIITVYLLHVCENQGTIILNRYTYYASLFSFVAENCIIYEMMKTHIRKKSYIYKTKSRQK